ncbi:DUF4097 family beta strand repeat-containing protein [Verrucosispora sp. WMMA2044]|uniref:DUF4097 domain-containing protein n=2 Tax=Micromonospora TaxID=1873 RepID=A0A6M1LAD8_9ACTN|nr:MULTISPECIES: DUF4097 family beta strand repeat-containing protein [Micromonospora]NEE66105.1 DUF4097 domain-containing protein [Verrucosispora sioxanthis]NGM15215.1 DUF4097 domain-containing protein [Verrucosispora sioxanthis]WBB51669.1 DUF4097 family beta strand repeat-containing protein [Verrucosispora sp. WMMA2044]
MQRFDTPAAISAVLDIPAGRIQIIAADRTDTTVEILPTDAGKSRDVTAAERVVVTFDDNVLRVQAAEPARRILGSSGSVEVTVQLPAGSRVEAEAASVEFRGVGRLGDVTFDGAEGVVKLDETAQARLTLQSGDITVGRLGGPGQISTQRGDLTVAEAVAGTVTLRTEQGNITIGAARDSSATLDAGTTYGRVRNELRNTDGAAAGLNIHATTAYGDIAARSL